MCMAKSSYDEKKITQKEALEVCEKMKQYGELVSERKYTHYYEKYHILEYKYYNIKDDIEYDLHWTINSTIQNGKELILKIDNSGNISRIIDTQHKQVLKGFLEEVWVEH